MFRIIPATIWMMVIFYLSSQTRMPNPTSVSSELVAVAGHLISYGILVILIWYALGVSEKLAKQRLIIAFVLTVMYGISDEFHQAFVPGRTATVYDILTDAIGALAVISIIMYSRTRADRRMRNKRS